VLSDTHGHINEAALAILKQTDVILHAGDIDRPEVLDALHTIGRIIPVRGNMDIGAWAEQLPKEEFVELGPILIYVTHDRTKISLDPEAAGIHVVVSGHTHRPEMMRKNGVLYLNPGSASFPRGGPQASIALLRINDGIIACRHITL
jgi:putative phosphoesterase